MFLVNGGKMKLNIIKFIIVILVLFLSIYFFYQKFYNMNNLPEGEFIESLKSPNEKYLLNAYRYSGGAPVDWTLRVEVENIETGEKKNIYWNYHEKEAEWEWIDNDNIIINNHKLNIHKDSYDFRWN